jgi:RNA polymerase sigma factor (sigma-70 family)
MAASLDHVLSQIQRWTSPRLDENSDALLLQRFVQHRDERAFATLVSRHGGMVLRSCRRVLGDVHAAEDAFQAVFLVLARKAHTLRRPTELPGWLHGVARRVALKARTKSVGRAAQMPLSEELPDTANDPLTRLTARELLTVLDEEVARLPGPQRSAVVLCCLEGHPQEEAARMLGWTAGSLKGHLERGRRRLHDRLQRRGITLSAALALVAVSRSEAASELLVQNTIKATLSGEGGSAAALAHSVLKTMFVRKLAGVMAVTLTLALAASTTVALVYHDPVEVPEDKTPAAPAALKDAGTRKSQVRRNAPADPLPSGAIARLGTQRLRHGGWIKFVAFTPDDKRLVSQGEDGVCVWDAATGKELHHLLPEAGKIWGATDMSPDGKQVAAAIESQDGHIDIWDIASGKKTASFGKGYYALVRLSPDGKRLAAYETAKAWLATVEVWDVESQRRLLSWKAHERQQVMSLFFSSDSRRLFTSSFGGNARIRIWDAATGRQLCELPHLERRSPIGILSPFNQNEALSPDGKLLALVESDAKSSLKIGDDEWKARISLHDTMTGEQLRLLTCPFHAIHPVPEPAFSALTFTPDGKKLLTGGPGDSFRVWDTATGEELHRGPLEVPRPWSLTLSRDGKTLAVVMQQGYAIQLLNMASGKSSLSHAGHLAQVYLSALTPEGGTAITVAGDSNLLLWDVATSQVRHVLEGHDRAISALQLAQDGRMLFTLGEGKTLRVWDLPSEKMRRRIPLDQEFSPSAFGALALSPDGGTLAVLSATNTVRLFDTNPFRERLRFETRSSRELTPFPTADDSIRGSAFVADGHSLVTWTGDLKVSIWDATTGRRLREYPLTQDLRIGQPIAIGGRGPTNYQAALSPDGRLLAIGSNRHVLPLEKCFLVFKDLATGRDIRRLDKLPTDVHRIAFSPDGRMLAWSGRWDPTIYLMETASGRERRRFAGHLGWVLSLAFSADGERLISGSKDTTALVWDLGRRLDRSKTPAAFTAAEVEKRWADLAGDDAACAYEAIRKLAAVPNAAIPFLRKHLPPVPLVEEKRLARLLADLDSDDFAARQKATAELEKLGELALPEYRKMLEGKPALETRRRLEDLQAKAHVAWWDISGERLRMLRAIEVLEVAGSKEAREVLETLAAGAAGARLTEEAKAAIHRLAKRGANGLPAQQP